MIKPRCISSQNSRHCEIDVSNCWNELYRDTSWLPCSKYQILNQTNVWAIHFDKSCWFVKNWERCESVQPICFLTPPLENRLKLWSSETGKKRPIFKFSLDGSVTKWPGRVGVVIYWSQVQTPTCYSLDFFFVCLVFNCVAALCLSPASIIFPSLTTYYPY